MSTRRVVLLMPDSKNPYMQLSAEAAAQAAERLDVDLDIQFAEGDFTTQVRQLYVVTRALPRPAIVMMTPVQESALGSLSEQTVASGIGWFWLNRSIGNERALRQQYPRVPVSLISPDQREAGRIQARQVKALLPSGGRILYMQGRMTNQSARLRADAFHDAVRRTPGLEMIGDLDGNWAADAARQAISRWLDVMRPTPLRPDVIVCQNDAMASGVLEALKGFSQATGDAEVARTPVIGSDGLRAIGRHMVDAGALAATVLLPTATDRAVAAAAAFFESGELPPAEITLAPQAYPDEVTMIRRWRRTA